MNDRERTKTTVVQSTCRQRLRVSRNGNGGLVPVRGRMNRNDRVVGSPSRESVKQFH
jgi:hypothetical protein